MPNKFPGDWQLICVDGAVPPKSVTTHHSTEVGLNDWSGLWKSSCKYLPGPRNSDPVSTLVYGNLPFHTRDSKEIQSDTNLRFSLSFLSLSLSFSLSLSLSPFLSLPLHPTHSRCLFTHARTHIIGTNQPMSA